MQNKNDIIKTSLIIDKSLWGEFKNYAKFNNSDASKELRNLIKNYVKNNKKKLKK